MGLASKKPQTPSFPALDLVLYLFELFRVTSAELVKWGDANETKREQRERERSHPVLVDGGSFVRCACRCGFDASRANRAGRCASVPTGGSGSFCCAGDESDARSCGGTASGEVYNQNEMTACHPTLPFGTKVRVVNTRNHRAVVVRITDRGILYGR